MGVYVCALLGRYRASNGLGCWLVGLVASLFCPCGRNKVSSGWRTVFYLGHTISTSSILVHYTYSKWRGCDTGQALRLG